MTIRMKLFWGMTGLIMLFVAVSQFLNSGFLEDYYVMEKKKQLMETYAAINDIYQGDLETISLELEKLERTTGIHIVIFNSHLDPMYPSQVPREEHSDEKTPIPKPQAIKIQASDSHHSYPKLKQLFERKLIQDNMERLKLGDDVITLSEDPRIQTNFINLVKTLNNGDYIILNTPFASISESVRIANRFFLFTGILTFIVGSIITYLFAKRLTLPILKLNEIAQRMTKLDFDKKYKVNTNDEVGQLGDSINSLSTQLNTAITELTEANSKLVEDIERERRIDEMRRNFISNVSHELKTPIALIQGYAEGLKENVIEDEEGKNFYCEVIADETSKMDNLVRDLLDLSQVEAGTFKLEKSNFEISQLIEEVIDKCKPIFLDKNIDLNLEVEPGLIVSADRLRTEQIIFNYLNNAINHVDEKRKINITINTYQNKARISVYNSGQPIAEESLDKVWESFYKVDKARTRAYGGTGLGLSIVKAIQEKDNNQYGVLNKDNGVEFWFELDLAKNHDQ